MRRTPSLFLALLLAAPAAPPSSRPASPTTYDRAIAAGYKALTLCSGIFNARPHPGADRGAGADGHLSRI